MKLSELNIGESAVIQSVEASGALRQHLLDMGLIQGCVVSCNIGKIRSNG